MTDLEKVLGKPGARKFWDKVWGNVKILTGDVAYNTKGDLQTQINAVADTASTAKTTADAAKTAAEDAKVAAGEIVTDTTDKFDSTKDYAVGDYVIYDNKAWKFTTVHPAGAWDESHVEQTNILAEIAAQNKNFAELNENFGNLTFAQDADGNWGYKVGGADPVIPFKQSIKIRENYYSPEDSGNRYLTYSIPKGKDGYMILWQDYISTKGESKCSVSGAKLISNKDGIYNMQYDRQGMLIYSFTGGATIKITRGTYSNGISGVYVIILY